MRYKVGSQGLTYGCYGGANLPTETLELLGMKSVAQYF